MVMVSLPEKGYGKYRILQASENLTQPSTPIEKYLKNHTEFEF